VERPGRAVLTGIAVSAAIIILTTVMMAAYWPFKPAKLAESLNRVVHGSIRFQRFRQTYFPPGSVAEEVSVGTGRDAIHMTRVAIEASFSGLLHHHLRRIVIDGAAVPFPLNAVRTDGNDQTGTVVDELMARDVIVQAGNSRFNFHRIRIQNRGAGKPFGFDIEAQLPKPRGELHTIGQFGPVQRSALAQTPLAGSYSFRNADLSVFDNFAGMLTSEGKYSGALSHADVTGSVDIPDFETNHNGHRHRLSTRFVAVVNGMNGDTILKRVEAKLDQTVIEGYGAVETQASQPGKTIIFDTTAGRGRVEDLLLLFVKSPQAPMVGPIVFRAHAVVPPSHERFTTKVSLDGQFDISGGEFSNPKTQAGADSLSEHAEGEPKERPERIRQHLRCTVALRKGTAVFSHSVFSVPGANAVFAGSYNLLNKRVNLHGSMAMQATLSQATTGVKSVFLKLLDPFYKKKHAGAVVPVSITGTYDHPQFQALMAKVKK
jgi:hypothetical protein